MPEKPARSRSVEKRVVAPAPPAEPSKPFAADTAERSNLQAAPASAAAPTAEKRAAGAQDSSVESERDMQLERIAALRDAGKTAEADAALARFRERWPDYAIPDALWQRVRPR